MKIGMHSYGRYINAQWQIQVPCLQQAAHTTFYDLLAAQQEPYKKAQLLTKTVGRNFWRKKIRRIDH